MANCSRLILPYSDRRPVNHYFCYKFVTSPTILLWVCNLVKISLPG